MKKIILVVFSLLLINSLSQAQNLSLFARGNFSIGSEYNELDYAGDILLYSGGGGMGLEIGLQKELVTDFSLGLSLGYQLNLAFLGESIDGVTNSSSAFFNRKFLSLGVIKGFKLSHRTVTHILLGTGTQYNTPGRLQRVENEDDLDDISYKSAFSFYFEGGIRLKLSDNLSLDPTIRYRSLEFEADDIDPTAINLIDADLVNYNARGVELALTLVRRF